MTYIVNCCKTSICTLFLNIHIVLILLYIHLDACEILWNIIYVLLIGLYLCVQYIIPIYLYISSYIISVANNFLKSNK